jgi:2-keto-4-pentenoate hydratase/2-oxohepta-3-ene-1,7-dioic acid hydratase in catechol pathway
MRLVTYDRRGHRRLGAILEGEVVDLPDVVGHPAFPTTLEALVASSGGTVMDAARTALERSDATEHRVRRPRLLPPLFPRSLLMPGGLGGERRIVAPEDEVAWPAGAAWLEYEPKIAAVLGREGRDLSPAAVAEAVFGFTLVNDWTARDATGDPVEHDDGLSLSLGPCIVTADELDPQTIFVEVQVDGTSFAKGNLNGSAQHLLALIAAASAEATLERGDAFALSPFAGASRDLWPGAAIELGAEGIGTLRNRLAVRAAR